MTIRQNAQYLMDLIDTLTLLTRKTLLTWMPELVSATGVTAERYMVMFELSLQPDISLKTLSDNLLTSPPTMSVMVNSLVELEMVTRITDPADRRRVVLRLSAEGEEELQRVNRELLDRYTRYLSDLSEEDQNDLGRTSQALLTVVQRIMEREKQ